MSSLGGDTLGHRLGDHKGRKDMYLARGIIGTLYMFRGNHKDI